MSATLDRPEGLLAKVHPARFANMSPRMAALVGYLIGEEFTNPVIVSLTVTSDKFLLAMRKGDIGFNDFIESEEDFKNNLEYLINAVPDLTDEEKHWLWARFDSITRD